MHPRFILLNSNKNRLINIICSQVNITFLLGINCWNPAFDVTPCNLITGIITEVGVFTPNELYEKVNQIQNS